ncbi:MAG: gamma-glutamyl-gamma-aminobutyrate hydrolase family protein [Candidatus Dormibacteraeota bacterium]|nr:gamma-glutamyl-gamma-aminobutyrate hydrolase family protein [Candidatus Dormibacteraeota bacterium]
MKSSRRPLIGITCGTISEGKQVKYGQNSSYVRAIEQAGGVPLLIPPQASIDELFDILDGILFTGGGDLEPTLYDTEDRGSKGIDKDRDALELALARRAVDDGLPIFGICRGQQLINVALEGGLLQDVGAHRQDAGREAATHQVEVEPGSHLAEVLGERVDVNTFHHQVVDPQRIGRGLKVSAFSADGERFIEGLESDDGKILAVQWHPEDMTDREWSRRLFRRLVEVAAARTPAPSR